MFPVGLGCLEQWLVWEGVPGVVGSCRSWLVCAAVAEGVSPVAFILRALPTEGKFP